MKRKVFAYITHRGRLLLFRHPFSPEAGIQVPGGTVGPDEDPVTAVLREAREETGLANLMLVGFLGEAQRAMDDFPGEFVSGEVHHRFFYHLRYDGVPVAEWRHIERFGPAGEVAAIAFDFFWAPLPDGVPALIAEQGAFIPRLLESLDNCAS